MNDLQTLTAALNTIAALLSWLKSRGVTKSVAIALLEKAANENRDITSDEIRQVLDVLGQQLDETENLIRQMPQ